MAEKKKVLCSKCTHYSFTMQRCLLGKINPPTISGGISSAKIFGVDYICPKGNHRAKIVKAIQEEVLQQIYKQAKEINDNACKNTNCNV
jgi:hypothetical protein